MEEQNVVMQQTRIRNRSRTLPIEQGISLQRICSLIYNNVSPFIALCPKTATIFRRAICNPTQNISFLAFPMYPLTLVIPPYFFSAGCFA